MKKVWCWRCKMDIPMLDDKEFEIAYDLYKTAFKNIKQYKDLDSRFQPLLDYYKELTGFEETNPKAILHHKLSNYGPPCEKCDKPYRTSLATFCAACGNKRPS